MTMGLTVIMIVVIGVMGAGLLTFVATDLESVVEVNQGQRALEMADIGIGVAKRQLTVDARPSSYDTKRPTLCSSNPSYEGCNSSWYDNGNPDTCGKTMTFGGNEIRVCIRYLNPSSSLSQAQQPDQAPEPLPYYGSDSCNDTNGDGVDDDLNPPTDVDACEYPNNGNYFRVTVRAGSGNALRQVQAIYVTQNFEIPVAYYATRDIDFNGNSTSVSGLSIFANRYILNLRPERITGQDQAYGNWAVYPYTNELNPYNGTPRATTNAGAAALGGTLPVGCPLTAQSGLDYDPNSTDVAQKSFLDSPQRYGVRDFDRDSDYRCTGASLISSGRPDFRANTWGDRSAQPSGTITFPFATGDAAADDELLAALKEKAKEQGLYTRRTPGSTFTIDESGGDTPDYPDPSELTETVMFIEFANGTDSAPDFSGAAKGKVIYKARSGDSDNKVKGIIVVVNGSLDTSSSSDPFQGAMIVRDPNDTDNGTDNTDINCNSAGTVMDFCNSGSVEIEGFVNVEGDMKLAGSVDGFLPAEMANGLPGLFKVSLWSWRECYSTTCS